MDVRLDEILGEQRRRDIARDTGDWSARVQRLIDQAHPYQRDFALDTGRRVAALVPRGGGKTTAGTIRLVRRMMLTRRANCVFIASTRQAAEELIWQPLKTILENIGVEAHYNETKLVCTLRRNGSRLRLVGADNKREIDKLRGKSYHEVGIDEAASYSGRILEHLIERVIGPRLGDYQGSIWMVGTPGHILDGKFYDVTRQGSEVGRAWKDRDKPDFRGWMGWSVHGWTLQQAAEHVPAAAALWAEALIEKEANGWSDDHPVWKREYLAIWAADDTENVFRYRPHLEDGTPWNEWDPERDPKTGLAILGPGDWLYTYGLDLGHSDPFALEVFAHRGDSRELLHVYEYTAKGMYARTIAELLAGKEWVEAMTTGQDPGEPGGIIGATGWPYAIVADTAGLGGAILDELGKVYGIPIKAAEKKNKHDAIELFNGDLIDGRIKAMKGSELVAQMQGLQWAVDDWGKLKEHKSQRNDCTDAAVYARREAMHLYGGDAMPAEAPKHTRDQEWVEAQEKRMAAREKAEFSDLLAPGGFDDGWW